MKNQNTFILILNKLVVDEIFDFSVVGKIKSDFCFMFWCYEWFCMFENFSVYEWGKMLMSCEIAIFFW